MIEKILDKYYTKKLKQAIRYTMLEWFLDYEFRDEKNQFYLDIKDKKYNDNQYLTVNRFWYDESLFNLCNFHKIKDDIKASIERYEKYIHKGIWDENI